MKKLMIACLGISLLVGCSVTRVVEHNINQVNLADYSRIAWADEAITEDVALRLKTADEAIRADVEAGLIDKGYAIVADDAEVLVSWRLGHRALDVAPQPSYTIDDSFGDESMRDQIYANSVFAGGVDTVDVDIILLLFVDATTRKPLLGLEIRGLGDNDDTGGALDERIGKAIEKALKKIPNRS